MKKLGAILLVLIFSAFLHTSLAPTSKEEKCEEVNVKIKPLGLGSVHYNGAKIRYDIFDERVAADKSYFFLQEHYHGFYYQGNQNPHTLGKCPIKVLAPIEYLSASSGMWKGDMKLKIKSPEKEPTLVVSVDSLNISAEYDATLINKGVEVSGWKLKPQSYRGAKVVKNADNSFDLIPGDTPFQFEKLDNTFNARFRAIKFPSKDEYVLSAGINSTGTSKSEIMYALPEFSNYIDGGEGDDLILGEDWRDTLFCSRGDDHLNGGMGDDKYICVPGDGKDIIYDFAGEDELYLEGVSERDITFEVDRYDLIVSFKGTEVRIINQFYDTLTKNSSKFGIEYISYKDGGIATQSIIKSPSLK